MFTVQFWEIILYSAHELFFQLIVFSIFVVCKNFSQSIHWLFFSLTESFEEHKSLFLKKLNLSIFALCILVKSFCLTLDLEGLSPCFSKTLKKFPLFCVIMFTVSNDGVLSPYCTVTIVPASSHFNAAFNAPHMWIFWSLLKEPRTLTAGHTHVFEVVEYISHSTLKI